MNTYQIIILCLIGIVAGYASGLLGIGGAIIIIPILVFLLGMGQHEAQGTSLAIMLAPIGLLAVFNYYKDGAINFKYAIIIMIFFIIGSYFGSKMALSMNAKLLQKIFGILMIFLALKMIFSK